MLYAFSAFDTNDLMSGRASST